MNQDRNHDDDASTRQSDLEQAERAGSHERGRGPEGERNRSDRESCRRNSGGITNRPLDRERCEQERLPERGQSQAERRETPGSNEFRT